MALGRNFTEALQKALRSLEAPQSGSGSAVFDWHQEWVELDKDALLAEIAVPHDGRLKKVMDALRAGATPDEVFESTRIDPWFVDQLVLVLEVADTVRDAPELTADLLRLAKRLVRANLTINIAETDARRTQAAQAVKDAVISVKKGQRVIGDGELVNETHLVMLRGMRAETDRLYLLQLQVGGTGLVALLVVASYIF